MLQDLIIPAFKPPAQVASSPLLGGPVLERKHLLFFRGDVGLHRLPNYSRGIRWGAHAHPQSCPAGIAAAGLELLQKLSSEISMAWHLRAAHELFVLTTCISGTMCTSCIFRQPASAHHARTVTSVLFTVQAEALQLVQGPQLAGHIRHHNCIRRGILS